MLILTTNAPDKIFFMHLKEENMAYLLDNVLCGKSLWGLVRYSF